VRRVAQYFRKPVEVAEFLVGADGDRVRQSEPVRAGHAFRPHGAAVAPEPAKQIKLYEDNKIAGGFYDMAIGNLPFANDARETAATGLLNPSKHDLFFLKVQDQTLTGGLVVDIAPSCPSACGMGRST
jgi:hypothetical protein